MHEDRLANHLIGNAHKHLWPASNEVWATASPATEDPGGGNEAILPQMQQDGQPKAHLEVTSLHGPDDRSRWVLAIPPHTRLRSRPRPQRSSSLRGLHLLCCHRGSQLSRLDLVPARLLFVDAEAGFERVELGPEDAGQLVTELVEPLGDLRQLLAPLGRVDLERLLHVLG